MKLINFDLRDFARSPTLVREFAPLTAVRQRQGFCLFDFNHRTPQECTEIARGDGKTVVDYMPYV